jgi:hypothetical protein
MKEKAIYVKLNKQNGCAFLLVQGILVMSNTDASTAVRKIAKLFIDGHTSFRAFEVAFHAVKLNPARNNG